MRVTRKKEKNAMVIVEPRSDPLLKTAIENFDKVMDKSWDLYVFHGTSNGELSKKATLGLERNVHLISLQTDNLTPDTYNELFKKKSFWNKIHAENILVFQIDSALCGNSLHNIKEFMKYGYIGCSVNNTSIGKGYWGKNVNFYGVGGLSFRKKSFTLKCINDNPNIPKKYPEDVFYSNCVSKSKMRPRKASTLSKFCTQDTYTHKSFGAHKTRRIQNTRRKRQFVKFCPEVKKIGQL